MPRPPRSHLPGTIFHLTTRTVRYEPWFTPDLRSRVVAMVRDVVARSDVRLLAYVIMPNHLHLLVQQGEARLGHLMQPLLTRAATAIRQRHRIRGHVFERRYRDRPCADPYYARNAIAYCHLNPVRAGLVADASLYPWSSHALYSGDPDARRVPGPDPTVAALGLRLFARPSDGESPRRQRRAHDAFLAYRLERDSTGAADSADPADPFPLPPGRWSVAYAPLFPTPVGTPLRRGGGEKRRPELRRIARAAVAETAAGLSVADVRSRLRTPPAVAARREIVRRAHRAGYPGTAIARYLRVSPQCVSKILAAD